MKLFIGLITGGYSIFADTPERAYLDMLILCWIGTEQQPIVRALWVPTVFIAFFKLGGAGHRSEPWLNQAWWLWPNFIWYIQRAAYPSKWSSWLSTALRLCNLFGPGVLISFALLVGLERVNRGSTVWDHLREDREDPKDPTEFRYQNMNNWNEPYVWDQRETHHVIYHNLILLIAICST